MKWFRQYKFSISDVNMHTLIIQLDTKLHLDLYTYMHFTYLLAVNKHPDLQRLKLLQVHACSLNVCMS